MRLQRSGDEGSSTMTYSSDSDGSGEKMGTPSTATGKAPELVHTVVIGDRSSPISRSALALAIQGPVPGHLAIASSTAYRGTANLGPVHIMAVRAQRGLALVVSSASATPFYTSLPLLTRLPPPLPDMTTAVGKHLLPTHGFRALNCE